MGKSAFEESYWEQAGHDSDPNLKSKEGVALLHFAILEALRAVCVCPGVCKRDLEQKQKRASFCAGACVRTIRSQHVALSCMWSRAGKMSHVRDQGCASDGVRRDLRCYFSSTG